MNWIPLSSSVYFFGMILSGVLIPFFADWKGRRMALICSSVVTGLGMITLGLSPNVIFLVVMFFIVGIGFAAQEIITLVYCSEISGKSFRNHSMVIILTLSGISQVTLGLMFAFIYYWRHVFVLAIGVPAVLCSIVIYFFLDETPRFLVSKLQFSGAIAVLQRMAMINRRPPFLFRLTKEMEFDNQKFFCIKKQDLTKQGRSPSPSMEFAAATQKSEFRISMANKISKLATYVWQTNL